MRLPKEFKPSPTLAYVFVTIAAFLWAASTVVGRSIHQEMPPFGMNFWRWFLAAMVLLLFVWRELPDRKTLIIKHWRLILVLGALQVGSSGLLFFGLNFTTAVNTTLLNAAQPALTVLPAWLLTRDKVTLGQGIGIFAAFLGIIVMVSKGDLGVLLTLNFNVGDILALTAILGWSVYATIIHRLPNELGFGIKLFLIFFAGSMVTLPFYIVETTMFRVVPFTGSAIGIIVILGIVVSLGSISLWNMCLSAVGPNRASIFLNLIPVFGVSLAIIFLGERLFSYHIAGASLVGLGILLVILRARRR